MTAERCARRNCPNGVHGYGLCAKHRRAAVAAGEFESHSLVPAGPVRDHVIKLNAAGIPYDRLAELAGVSDKTLRKMPQLTKVRRCTAARILAVPVPAQISTARAGVCIDSTGTVRRLRALIAAGHSQDYLAERLSMFATNLRKITRGGRTTVTARRARQVAELFTELQFTIGPSQQARDLGAERGWALPLAWDEDTIDDPNAVPDTGSRRRGSASERIESCTVVGITDVKTIADKLGVLPKSIERHVNRMKEAS